MKSLLLLTLCPLVIASCEQRPLKRLQEMYTMEQLTQFKKERSVKMFMYNHIIAHDDLDLLKMFFTQPHGKESRVVYQDLLLSQADRQGQEPVYFHTLHLAAQFGAENIASFCVENGASTNCVTISNTPEFNNNTPAHIAAKYGQFGILAILATSPERSSRGAFVDIKNGLNHTPEDIAREKQNPVIINLLKQIREQREKRQAQNPT